MRLSDQGRMMDRAKSKERRQEDAGRKSIQAQEDDGRLGILARRFEAERLHFPGPRR